jgi:hypothetical protein
MTNHQILLKGLNITIVYQALNINNIDRQRIKSLLGNTSQVIITEIPPDLLVFIEPATTNMVQFGDRRIRITNQASQYTDLSRLATEINDAVPYKQIIAFGLNYDFQVKLVESEARIKIMDIFGESLKKYLEKLGSNEDPLVFLPRVIYRIDGVQHDLILEPPEPSIIGAHLNVHFESNQLPGLEELANLQRTKYDYCTEILNNLLE